MIPVPAPASIPVSLRRLFPDASFVGCAEIVVTAAMDRSGDCTPGSLFAALPGTNVHGRAFVADAVARGATAILTDAPLPSVHVPQCIVADPRAAYAQLCHSLARWPSRQLGVVGVTGTNGKTSVTWLVRSILESAGLKTGLAGTILCNNGSVTAPSSLTTPDSRTLAAWLGSARDSGCSHFALEISSHALDQRRADGLLLDAAIVTNVTQDHFDYHGTAERYRAAKARIARLLKRGGRLIVNADDPGSRAIAAETPAHSHCRTFGLHPDAEVRASAVEITPQGCRFTVTAGIESVPMHTPLVGRHNISNALAAIAAALHLGLSLEQVAHGVAALENVPGRMQSVDCGQPFRVLVDYAHTADALARAIEAAREMASGRVLCVFGAGGDRDRSKRPDMGRAATRADLAIITSDNPRSEDPHTIIREVQSGCGTARVHVEPDRELAIAWAIQQARPGDVVLVAGKGHENVQIIGTQRIPFDDVAVCRHQILQRARSLPSPALAPASSPVSSVA